MSDDMRVFLVDYDRSWPRRFAEQRDRLAVILEPWLAAPIEHVGSTSVPGLAAKPVIDMAAPVDSLDAARAALPALARAGWCHWPDDPKGDRRLWFLYPRPAARTHHLYLIGHDDVHLRDLIVFRDTLRTDATTRSRYVELKQTLAQAHPHDRNAYTAGKTAFVADVVRRASSDRGRV